MTNGTSGGYLTWVHLGDLHICRIDADALDAWPERHRLATHLGPNRNGRQW